MESTEFTGPAEITVRGPAGGIAVLDHGGTGPDVVLLHGGNRTLLDWEPLRPHLVGFRTVAYDLRGHGCSDTPADEDYGWAAHLADLDAVIGALGLDSPRVVGHSLGGMIAVCHAARSSGCPGVVDLDGFGGVVPGMYPGLPAEDVLRLHREQVDLAAAALGPDVLDAEQAATVVEQADGRARLLGLETGLEKATARRTLEPSGLSGHVRRKPAPSAQTALVAPLEGWSAFDVLREEVTCPVLLVHGVQPPPLSHLPDEYRVLNEALIAGVVRELAALPREGGPDAQEGPVRVARVEEAGHLLHLQSPERVGGLVRAFLDEHTAG